MTNNLHVSRRAFLALAGAVFGAASLACARPSVGRADEAQSVLLPIGSTTTDTNGQVEASYALNRDEAGRLVSIDASVSGSWYSNQFTYDDLGHLTVLERPSQDSEAMRFGYDGHNRLIRVEWAHSADAAAFAAQDFTYDEAGRLTGIVAWSGDAAASEVPRSGAYNYLATTYANYSSSTSLVYDENGACTQVSCAAHWDDTAYGTSNDMNAQVSFEHDDAGTPISYSTADGQYGALDLGGHSSASGLGCEYDAGGHMVAAWLDSAHQATFAYDESGNLTGMSYRASEGSRFMSIDTALAYAAYTVDPSAAQGPLGTADAPAVYIIATQQNDGPGMTLPGELVDLPRELTSDGCADIRKATFFLWWKPFPWEQ